MPQILERLCTLLEAETARQEEVYQACLALRMSVALQKLEQVESDSKSIAMLIRAAKAAERERLDVVSEVVQAYKVPPERRTLTGLIQLAPEPWRERLSLLQSDLRRIVEASQNQVRELNRCIHSALRSANEAMNSLGSPTEHPYDARGAKPMQANLVSALIDQKG